MDLQQLTTFVAVSSERSLVGASRKLGVSQPTVTARMQQLEEELGEHLIIRAGHEAVLTPAGELFRSYAERAIQVLAAGLARLQHESSDRSLKIAGTSVFNTCVLPDLLARFDREKEGIHIQVLTGSTRSILDWLQDQVADLGFVHGASAKPHVLTVPLYSEEIRLYVHRGHPLASREVVSLHDLADETVIVGNRDDEARDLIESRFRQEGFRPAHVMEMDHVGGMKQMLLAGMGAAFLPESAVRGELGSRKVKKLELDGSPIMLRVSIALPDRALNPITRAFVAYIHRSFRSDPLPLEVRRLLMGPG